MATVDKLNKLLETKNAIKNALLDKGVEISDTDTFSSYSNKILSIKSGGGFSGVVKEVVTNSCVETVFYIKVTN